MIEKRYHANMNQKKAGMDILVSDKEEFRAKKIARDRGRHFIMVKWSITKTT